MKNTPPPIMMSHNQWPLLHASLDWVTHDSSGPASGTGFSIPSADSSKWTAIWVQKGRISIRMGNRTTVANTGEWLYRQPGRRSYQVHPGTEFFTICFSIHWTGSGRLVFPPKQPFWKCKSSPELEEKANLLYHFSRQNVSRPTARMQTLSISMETHFQYLRYFYDWLICWEKDCRKNGTYWNYAHNMDEKVVHATRYLDEVSPYDSIRVDEIAHSLGISVVHLIRLFQQQYGTSPKAYHMKRKLKQAMQEIQTTVDEIKEIASRFGYSQPWFCSWIKRETGKTPTQIRNDALS